MQKMALTTCMKHTLVEEDQAWEYLSKLCSYVPGLQRGAQVLRELA